MKLPVFLIASANWPEMPIIQLATGRFCPSYNKQTNKRGGPCKDHPFLFRYERTARGNVAMQTALATCQRRRHASRAVHLYNESPKSWLKKKPLSRRQRKKPLKLPPHYGKEAPSEAAFSPKNL